MAHESDDPIINAKDFESIRLLIEIHNLTSQTRFGSVDPAKSVNPEAEIQFLEFSEEGIVLDTPKGICAEGHQLEININALNSDPHLNLKVLGKVEEKEQMGPHRARVRIHLTQFLKQQWEAFQGLYAAKQEDVFRLLESIRGR